MNPPAPAPLTRREALVRAAALAGLSLSPAWIDRVLAATAGPVASLPPARAAVLAAAAERILPRTDTSGAETGWSQITRSGEGAGARAMTMRWRWPPENSCG